MNFFAKKIGVLVISALSSFHLFAQEITKDSSNEQGSNKIKAEIDTIVDTYFSNKAFEGAILVSMAGQIVFQNSYGYADRTKGQPHNANSSFQLASLSKPITATLILMLEQQGKLKLNNTLADYFPEFKSPGAKEITLHHLLSHTSGIPNHFIIEGWFDGNFHDTTTENDFIHIIAKLPRAFPPRD